MPIKKHPGGVISGTRFGAILFIILVAIGALISFFNLIMLDKIGATVLMLVAGFGVAGIFYRIFKDWFYILLFSAGFIFVFSYSTEPNFIWNFFFYLLGFITGVAAPWKRLVKR